MDIFSAFGLSASAGLNAYIPLLVVALLGKFTNIITLSSPWDTLESWWVIGVLVVLSGVEFFADKIPVVNHINDIIQTVIRPVAGAIVFAASAQIITDIHPVLAMVMGLIVAGTVHAVKSLAVRPAVTATTAGVGNVPVSIAEDVISTLLSIIAAITPVLIAVLLVLGGALLILWIWRRTNRERGKYKTPEVR
jgi:ABC-type Co2+ transport system permease subunit